MKNFQKDFDRLLNNLKEAKDILRECNLEMQKASGETKCVKYAIFEPETEMYLCEDNCGGTQNIKNAKLFDTIQLAKERADYETFCMDRKFEIKIIQLKVVE